MTEVRTKLSADFGKLWTIDYGQRPLESKVRIREKIYCYHNLYFWRIIFSMSFLVINRYVLSVSCLEGITYTYKWYINSSRLVMSNESLLT